MTASRGEPSTVGPARRGPSGSDTVEPSSSTASAVTVPPAGTRTSAVAPGPTRTTTLAGRGVRHGAASASASAAVGSSVSTPSAARVVRTARSPTPTGSPVQSSYEVATPCAAASRPSGLSGARRLRARRSPMVRS